LENLQREDLNAMEVALSYKRMMEELEPYAGTGGRTHGERQEHRDQLHPFAESFLPISRWPFGMERSAWAMRRALVNVDKIDQQLFIFDEIRTKGLSVRQTENLVRSIYKEKEAKKPAINSLPEGYKKVEDKLASHFSTRVKMKHSKNGSGQITFDYYSLQELNKLLDQMNVTIE
jgi:ParB family chromosome partitioning protein